MKKQVCGMSLSILTACLLLLCLIPYAAAEERQPRVVLEGLRQGQGDEWYAFPTEFDGYSDGTVRTNKRYYYYRKGSQYREYGAETIYAYDLYNIPGLSKVLDAAQDSGMGVDGGYYRGNGILNINLARLDDSFAGESVYENWYVTFRWTNDKFVLLEDDTLLPTTDFDAALGIGHYDYANTPSIADYPTVLPWETKTAKEESQDEALRKLFVKETGKSIDRWRCDDYDGDGDLEAFVEVGPGAYDHKQIYFVTKNSVTLLLDGEMMYVFQAYPLPKLGIKLQYISARHGWYAFYAVQNGKAIRLTNKTTGFYDVGGTYGGDQLLVYIDKRDDLPVPCYVDTTNWSLTFTKPSVSMRLPDLTLPSSTRSIGTETFMGLYITVVKCPEGLQTIYPRAFKDCKNLAQIYIPQSVTTIMDDVFDGCPDYLTIFCRSGSTAQRYAKEHGIDYVIVK